MGSCSLEWADFVGSRWCGLGLEICTGMGMTGIPRNPREIRGKSAGMGTVVAGIPQGWN